MSTTPLPDEVEVDEVSVLPLDDDQAEAHIERGLE